MTILHTLNKPASHTDLTRQLSDALTEHDSVLLIEDGVYQVLNLDNNEKAWHNIAKQIFVLKEDALSRGMPIDNPAIEFISYPEFVELSIQYSKVISWY